MVDRKKKECIVCSREGSVYKCPRCLAFYCSSGCCKLHKQESVQCGSKTVPKMKVKSESEKTMDLKDVPSTTACAEAANSAVDLGEKSQTIVGNYMDFNPLLLPEEAKEALRNSAPLQSILRSKRLRDDILCIDSAGFSEDNSSESSKNNNTKRQSALRQMRSNNAEFARFVDLVVDVVNTSSAASRNTSGNKSPSCLSAAMPLLSVPVVAAAGESAIEPTIAAVDDTLAQSSCASPSLSNSVLLVEDDGDAIVPPH